MKRLLLVALVFGCMCVPAFAGNDTQSINIPEKFSVAGKELPPGEYKVSWKTMGSAVMVSFEQKNVQKPASASAAATQIDAKNGITSYEIDKTSGTAVLKSLIFKKFSLVLQNDTAKAAQ